MSGRIADHFERNMYYGGLTYNAHPMSLAAAIATLEVMEHEDIVGNARRMGKVMTALLDDLKSEHPSIGEVRSIGLFGVIELVKNRETREPLAPFNASSPAMDKLAAFLREKGLFAFIHWNNLFANPPLIISEEQLKEVFDIINQGLEIADQVIDR